MTTQLRQVARWDAWACARHGRELLVLADQLERAYQQLSGTEARLGGWRGPAADRALPRLRLMTVRVSLLAGLLRQAAAAVRAGVQGVADAARLATQPAQSAREAAEVAALAAAVDGRVATRLSAVPAGLSVPLPARSGPPPGSGPAEVTRWWTALPPHLRRLELQRQPASLGALGGLPARARDQANRLQLSRVLRRLRAERDLLLPGGWPWLPAQQARIVVLDGMLAVAEGVERMLASLADRRPCARLLTLDLSGAGRVAIALGDLDRADHIAVVVPGMGADARHGVVGTVRRADQLCHEAARQSVESTAAVAWIGYAAPGWRQVPFPARARVGGRLLAADLDALAAARTADGGEPAHVTVVGHSYGSTVAGAAVRFRPGLADDLVLLGSPGVLAEDVSELGLPGSHVYVGEARLDPVADLGAFGADPGDRGFGATRIRADPGPGISWPDRLAGGDHSRYFDDGSESLRNVARVVVGRGADVTEEG